MQVTKVNNSMKEAILKRAEKLGFESITKLLGENDGFMVMIHSSDDPASDLTDKGYWQVTLLNDQTSSKPAFIKQVRQKELSKQFIPNTCLLYTSPSPRDRTRSRMPSSA